MNRPRPGAHRVLSDRVQLAHGAGGPLMRALIEQVLAPELPPGPAGSLGLDAMDDGAAFPFGDSWIVLTTDAHVVSPLFFPGGDIGRLAVSGTVNDLCVMGATEILGLACALIVEEGFSIETLRRIQRSLGETAREAGTTVVTGDTKVMGKGEVDGIVLCTTGLGMARRLVRDAGVRAGDRIVVSGTIGDHGFAVMAARGSFELEGDLVSDVRPLRSLIDAALVAGGEHISAMKDPTRGGLAAALSEMAWKSGVGVLLQGPDVPMRAEVRAAGEILGIDPLHVANEGKVVLAVRPDFADRIVETLRAHPDGRDARIVGTAVEEHPGLVAVDTGFGRRLLPEPDGELLPRIC